MGDNRGMLAKLFESRVKLSRGPFKPWFWSLDPTDRGLTRPDCNASLCCERDLIIPKGHSNTHKTVATKPGHFDLSVTGQSLSSSDMPMGDDNWNVS